MNRNNQLKENSSDQKSDLSKKNNVEFKKKLKRLRKLRRIRYQSGEIARKTKDKIFDVNDQRVQALLKMKTPFDYIDYCVKSDLRSSEKMQATAIWLKRPATPLLIYNMPGTAILTGKQKKCRTPGKEISSVRSSTIITME